MAIKIVNETTELAPVAKLRPHPRNPNRGDVDAIRESLRTNGFWGSVIVQRSTGYILAGEHRWRAAKAEGADAIPVTWVDVDDQTAHRIITADNATSRRGADDAETLLGLLQEVQRGSGSLQGTGHTEADIDGLLAALTPAPDPRELKAGQFQFLTDNDAPLGDASTGPGHPENGEDELEDTEPQDEPEGALEASSEPAPRFPLAVILDVNGLERWTKYKRASKLSKDTDALLQLLDTAGF